jgi:hypothetical protein
MCKLILLHTKCTRRLANLAHILPLRFFLYPVSPILYPDPDPIRSDPIRSDRIRRLVKFFFYYYKKKKPEAPTLHTSLAVSPRDQASEAKRSLHCPVRQVVRIILTNLIKLHKKVSFQE